MIAPNIPRYGVGRTLITVCRLVLSLSIFIGATYGTLLTLASFAGNSLPSFKTILTSGIRLIANGELLTCLPVTLVQWIIVLGCAVVLGSVLGFVSGSSELTWEITQPLFDLFRSMPATAYGFAVAMSVGDASAVIITASVSGAAVVAAYVGLGVRTAKADDAAISYAKALGASRKQIVTQVIGTSALRHFLDGFQVVLSLSLLYVVGLETVLVPKGNPFLGRGIGSLAYQLRQSGDFGGVLAGTFVIGLVGLTANSICTSLRRWRGV